MGSVRVAPGRAGVAAALLCAGATVAVGWWGGVTATAEASRPHVLAPLAGDGVAARRMIRSDTTRVEVDPVATESTAEVSVEATATTVGPELLPPVTQVAPPPTPAADEVTVGPTQNPSANAATEPVGADEVLVGGADTTTPTTAAATDSGAATMEVGSAPAESGQSRGEKALGELGIDIATLLPGWTIGFEGPRDGMRGTTFPYDHHIAIYMRDSYSDVELRHVIAHEVGHAVDVTYLNDEARARYLEARGAAGLQWWPGSAAPDYSSGAGDWAEAWAWNRMHEGPWYSNVASQPSAAVADVMASIAPN